MKSRLISMKVLDNVLDETYWMKNFDEPWMNISM
jgi:hypothetical protein